MESILLPVLILAALAVAAGIILTLAARFMAVPVDEAVMKVREALPGANCGACGLPGCDEYAKRLVHDGAALNLCTPGGEEISQALGEILGKNAGEVVAMRALIRCSGTNENTDYAMDYQGPKTCEGSFYFFRGRGKCSYSCVGFGDCAAACQYEAIKIENGIAVVDTELCTGCTMCIGSCPGDLITMIKKSNHVFVGCHSRDAGAVTRKLCKTGCIACKICEKVCKYDAIHVADNIAVIDIDKCTNCGECIPVCPTKIIHADCSLAEFQKEKTAAV